MIYVKLTQGTELVRKRDDFYAVAPGLRIVRISSRVYEFLSKLKEEGKTNTADLSQTYPLESTKLETLIDHLEELNIVEKTYDFIQKNLEISAVITYRVYDSRIKLAIESLKSQSYPVHEIICVKDGKSEEDEPLLQPDVKYVHTGGKTLGIAACRNIGLRVATGDVVAFTDSDCVADTHWLESLISFFENQNIVGAGGIVRSKENTALGKYEDTKSPLRLGERSSLVRWGSSVPFLVAANMLLRREQALDLGGFDETLSNIAEDVDLSVRLSKAFTLMYSPEGMVFHHTRKLGSLLRRRMDYSSSEALVYKKDNVPLKKLPITGLLVFLLIAPSLVFRSPLFLLPVAVFFLLKLNATAKYSRLLGLRKILAHLIHDLVGIIYHSSMFLTRYYLIVLLILGVLSPSILATGLVAFVAFSLLDYIRRRPHVFFLTYLGISFVDELSRNIGTYVGCLKYRDIRSVLPSFQLT